MPRRMIAPRRIVRPVARLRAELKYNAHHDDHGRFARSEGHAAAASLTHTAAGSVPTGSSRALLSAMDAKLQGHLERGEEVHKATPALHAERAAVAAISDRIVADPARLKALKADGMPPENQRKFVELTVRSARETWAESSASSPHAVAMQRAIAEEFGGKKQFDEMSARLEPSLRAQAEKVYAAHGAQHRVIVRAMYEHTQETLAKEGITEVTVHRGMAFDEGKAPKWTNYGYRDNVHLDPASSFSAHPGTAASFAGKDGEGGKVSRVITVTVPRERILSTARTGFGTLIEREVVVLGTGQTPAKIHKMDEKTRAGAMKTSVLGAPPPMPPPKQPSPPRVGTHEPKITTPVQPKTPGIPAKNDYKTPFESVAHAVKVRSTDLPGVKVAAAEDAAQAVHSVIPKATLSRQERLGIYTLQEGAKGNAPAAMGIAGQYTGGVSSKAMTLNKKSYGRPDDMQVTVHEMGHWLDNVIGQRQSGKLDAATSRQMGSDKLSPSNPQYNVFKAIQDTPELKKWQTAAVGKSANAEYHRYLTEPREVYARAFAQYVAYRSNHTDLVKGIKGRAETHWKLVNFEPVAKAFDEQFKKMGWQ